MPPAVADRCSFLGLITHVEAGTPPGVALWVAAGPCSPVEEGFRGQAGEEGSWGGTLHPSPVAITYCNAGCFFLRTLLCLVRTLVELEPKVNGKSLCVCRTLWANCTLTLN